MNGTKIIFETCAVIKLLDQQYDLLSLGINVDEAQFFTSVIVRDDEHLLNLSLPGLRTQNIF